MGTVKEKANFKRTCVFVSESKQKTSKLIEKNGKQFETMLRAEFFRRRLTLIQN